MNPYLVGGTFGAALFFGLTVARFERDSAAEIRSRLNGTSAKVEVRVRVGFESVAGVVPGVTIEASEFSAELLPFHTEPQKSKRGILKRLRIDLRNFTLAGLHVESLNGEVPGCRFDMGLAIEHHKFRLTRSGTGSVTVRVRDADFEPFIMKRFPEVRSVSVRMDRGKVTVDGSVQISILSSPFHVESKLAVRDGDQLVFVEPAVSLGGRPADPALAKSLLKMFDPVVDLNRDLKLEHAITVESIELKDGFLTANGKLTIPEASR